MALLWRNRTGYNRYLDRARTAASARDCQSRVEGDRGQSLTTGSRTSRYSHGRAHTWANRPANHIRLQSSYMGDGSAPASSKTGRTCVSPELWATCRWSWQPLFTRTARAGTPKELHGETRSEHSRDFVDDRPRWSLLESRMGGVS